MENSGAKAGAKLPLHRASAIGIGMLCVGAVVYSLGPEPKVLTPSESRVMTESRLVLQPDLAKASVAGEADVPTAEDSLQPLLRLEQAVSVDSSRPSEVPPPNTAVNHLLSRAHPYFPTGVELSPEQDRERTLAYLATLVSVAEENTKTSQTEQSQRLEPYSSLFAEAAAAPAEPLERLQYFDAATVVWIDTTSELQ